MKRLFGLICSARAYSWGDLVILGFMAKFMATGKITFEVKDLFMAGCLLSLWIFFNMILEIRHNNKDRQKASLGFSLSWLAVALALAGVGADSRISAISFIAISTFFVIGYLCKNKNVVLGITSPITRGFIQVMYFLTAIQFYPVNIAEKNLSVVALVVFFSFIVRSIAGDLRDVITDRAKNKNTFLVVYGEKTAKTVALILLLTSALIQAFNFGSVWVAFPALAFIITLPYYKNGYVLHQVSITFTTFTQLNLIAAFTGGSLNLTLLNIVFISQWLIIFYPLLIRKSNPIFIDEGEEINHEKNQNIPNRQNF